jgi:hypothetical protein
MYTQRILHAPALGKNAELRKALEARNSAGNAAAPHALSVSMFAIEPVFIHSIRFESLAAIEAYQERQFADPDFQVQAGVIAQCLARPQGVLLYEELAGTPVTGAPKFLIRNRILPAPGRERELRDVLEERVTGQRAPGLAGAGLSRQVASVDGPAFVTTLLFTNLAEVDKFRAVNDYDPTFASFVQKVASLTRGPTQQRMARILIPFPA